MEATMRLRDIDFGPCLDAAGTRGFWGERYWFHFLWIIGRWWWDFTGSTFVAKTTTTPARKGNTELTADWKVKHFFPSSISVHFFLCAVLNAVGLSGPGAQVVLQRGFAALDLIYNNGPAWPTNRPYMISWGPEGATLEEQLAGFREFVETLKAYLDRFPFLRRLLGLQINISCPNSDVNPDELTSDAHAFLDIAAELGIPVIPKINLLMPVPAIKKISEHPACDAICLANTVPFGALPERFPWDTWFPKGSPLAKFKGGGGLSGKPIFPLLEERVREIFAAGIIKPLNVGGGIVHKKYVDRLVAAGLRRGVDSIFIGSIAILRPWRIQSVIRRAHQLLA